MQEIFMNVDFYKKRKITKTIIKRLRLTDAEWSAIEKKLKETGMTFSKFALSSMLSKKIKAPIERELLVELFRYGNNLNQIAARLNSDESLDRVGLRILAGSNTILCQIYEMLGK